MTQKISDSGGNKEDLVGQGPFSVQSIFLQSKEKRGRSKLKKHRKEEDSDNCSHENLRGKIFY